MSFTVANGASGFSRFGQASAEVEEVFSGSHAVLAKLIAERAHRFGFEPKGQKTGYVNFSLERRAHTQIHPHPDGVALVVREATDELPDFQYLRAVPCSGLRRARGRNASWLQGDGRYTFRPAAAVLVPAELAESADAPGWAEVDAVLSYAKSKRAADGLWSTRK